MHEKFIARQPILDTRLQVFAYELLFRGGAQNSFQPFANAASSVIADSITLFDLDMFTGHARAFVNVDEMALRLGAPRLLPADRIVVEILESSYLDAVQAKDSFNYRFEEKAVAGLQFLYSLLAEFETKTQASVDRQLLKAKEKIENVIDATTGLADDLAESIERALKLARTKRLLTYAG